MNDPYKGLSYWEASHHASELLIKAAFTGYWFDVPERLAALRDRMQHLGRNHPMPGYGATGASGTYTQAHPKTYTPERVLSEALSRVLGPFNCDLYVKSVIGSLKKHGFEITPISVRERAEAR